MCMGSCPGEWWDERRKVEVFQLKDFVVWDSRFVFGPVFRETTTRRLYACSSTDEGVRWKACVARRQLHF